MGFGVGKWARLARGLLPSLVLGGLFLYSVWPWLPFLHHERRVRTLVFYGFSILGDVMTQGVFPAFQEMWRARTGEQIEFTFSFASSGTITNQVIMGVPADVCLVALEPDATRMATAGLTAPEGWKRLPHRGAVNRSPFVILVRPGNPKGIHDFEDLTRSGVEVVHPDPLTSGGAKWSILAEYGAAARRHPEDPATAGYQILLGIWRNVVAQAASARAARTQFQNGFGDALVTYEQDGLLDRSRGKLEAEIIYPHSTILSEHTLVILERNVRPNERALVQAFADFLWSETAQRLFVQYGFRSVDEKINAAHPALPPIADPFGIEDLGGWDYARGAIIDEVWKKQVLKELER